MRARTRVAQGAALLFGLPLVAFALVVLSDLIPDQAVMWRVHAAIVEGALEENSYPVGSTGRFLDGHSECKRMTVGLGAPEGMSVFESAIRSPTLGSCEVAVPKVLGWVNGEGLTRSYDYFRYWHGSAAVLRPSVALLGVSGTRIAAAVVLVGATIALARGLARRVGRAPTALCLAPLLLTTDFLDLPRALVHAIGMIVAIGGAALVVWFLDVDSRASTFAAAGFAAGASFLFFADLTNPDGAWALTVASAGAVVVGASPMASAVRRVVATAVGWIAGFAWLWFCKWLLAATVLGFATVRDVVQDQAEARLGGDVAGLGSSPFAGLSRAWSEWWDEPLIVVLVATMVVVAAAIAVRSGDLRATWQRRLLVAAPAAIPLVWHTILRNHTYIHGWFTHRSLAVALGIVLLAATARIVITPHADHVRDEDHVRGQSSDVIDPATTV